MTTINMLEAKTTLSRLVDAIEQGPETEIDIARNGKLAAKLVPSAVTPSDHRIGFDKFDVAGVLNGDLAPFHEALAAADQAARLASE